MQGMTRTGAGRPRRGALLLGPVAALALGAAACGSSPSASPARSTTTTSTPASVTAGGGITSAPVQVAQTDVGQVAYRQLGSGTPLLLLMGLGGSIDDWAPDFVDDLAASHRVIAVDNAGVGQTSSLPPPLTVTAMADQTSAFISALGLRRPDVLGWSMGGMVAQALAVLHPGQVGRLVLAATQVGTGGAVPIPVAAGADAASTNPGAVLSVLFPPGQAGAEQRYVHGIVAYPGYYGAPAALLGPQSAAVQAWLAGADPAGRLAGDIRAPTLVADGTVDALDPVANAHILADAIRGAQLALYPGAGHAFLFQDTAAFVPRVERFLG